MFYAQIDENGDVFGISELKGPVSAPDMIPIDSFDMSKFGKRYQNGQFVTPPPIARIRKSLTRDEFIMQFTAAEWKDTKTAIEGTDQTSIELAQMWDAIQVADKVSLSSPLLQNFTQKLVQKGAINSSRRDVILEGITE